MDYRALGRTGVKVSELCLGTMTFGEQNSEAEGHAQMDYAVDCGINIFDAAEIYPVPPKQKPRTVPNPSSAPGSCARRSATGLSSQRRSPAAVRPTGCVRTGASRTKPGPNQRGR